MIVCTNKPILNGGDDELFGLFDFDTWPLFAGIRRFEVRVSSGAIVTFDYPILGISNRIVRVFFSFRFHENFIEIQFVADNRNLAFHKNCVLRSASTPQQSSMTHIIIISARFTRNASIKRIVLREWNEMRKETNQILLTKFQNFHMSKYQKWIICGGNSNC